MKIGKYLSLVLALILIASLFNSCVASNGDDTNTADTTVGADVTTIGEADTTTADISDNGKVLMENSIGKYSIIRSEKASQTEINAAVNFNTAVKSLCGKMLPISEDFVRDITDIDKNALEILIGNTNREESSALASTLGKYQFAIKITETKIVIVAYSDIILVDAVDYFIENYLKTDRVTVSDGNLSLSFTDGEAYTSDGTGYDFATRLRSFPEFNSVSKKLFTVNAPSSTIKTPQGGYSDGKYFYQAFLQRDNTTNEAKNVVRIVKTEVATGKVVLTSGDLSTNHSNDITYNSKLGCLLVAHNNPNRTYLSMINAETLEFIRTILLPCSIYSIDYNETYDKYVVGISGGQNFRFLDANFKLVGDLNYATSLTEGYTTQGVTCDDNFIYFVLYNQNVITVYDWDGNFVTIIKFDVGNIEPENISVVDDRIYVTCISDGAIVYEITPVDPE